MHTIPNIMLITSVRAPLLHISLATVCGASLYASAANIPEYDFRQPVRDGVILVGMECNRHTESLELGIFEAGHPPSKRMDLWNTAHLVRYDAQTSQVTAVKSIDKQCSIGSDHFLVRLTGQPGASNAMALCGGIITASASVWKNGRKIFDQALMRCGAEQGIRLVRFVAGTDTPVLITEEQ